MWTQRLQPSEGPVLQRNVLGTGRGALRSSVFMWTASPLPAHVGRINRALWDSTRTSADPREGIAPDAPRTVKVREPRENRGGVGVGISELRV